MHNHANKARYWVDGSLRLQCRQCIPLSTVCLYSCSPSLLPDGAVVTSHAAVSATHFGWVFTRSVAVDMEHMQGACNRPVPREMREKIPAATAPLRLLAPNQCLLLADQGGFQIFGEGSVWLDNLYIRKVATSFTTEFFALITTGQVDVPYGTTEVMSPDTQPFAIIGPPQVFLTGLQLQGDDVFVRDGEDGKALNYTSGVSVHAPTYMSGGFTFLRTPMCALHVLSFLAAFFARVYHGLAYMHLASCVPISHPTNCRTGMWGACVRAVEACQRDPLCTWRRRLCTQLPGYVTMTVNFFSASGIQCLCPRQKRSHVCMHLLASLLPSRLWWFPA